MAKSGFKEKLDDALDQDPKVMMRDPFASIDAPYFTTDERNEQLALLEHLSRYSAMLFVVEGKKGSGKTAFLNEFARLQSDTAIISRVKASILMSAGQLLEKVYSGFPAGVKGLTPDASFGPLLKFALQREQQAQTVLILIDDAHELSSDAISMLLDMMSLANENQPAPHVVLFSNGSLQKNMDPYLQSRFDQLAHSQKLLPFDLQQTQSYLLHRVRSIGGQINLPFSESQIKTIYEESKGFPEAINQVARKMMGKASKSKFKLSFGFPLMHMALLSVIMLGILLVAIFQSPSKDEKGQQGTVIPLNATKRVSSPTIAKIDQVQQELENRNNFSLPPIPAGARVLPPTSERNNTSRQQNGVAKTETVKPISTATMTAPIVTAPIALATTDTNSVDAGEIAIKSTTNNTTRPATARVVQPEKLPSNAQIDSTNKFDKASWLLTQNPNRYSLQLLGAYTLSAVQDFIREQGSLNDLAYFKTVHNGRDWYVVVYGLYRNRGNAIAAIEELPKDLKALTPWARSVRGIQQDIRKIQ